MALSPMYEQLSKEKEENLSGGEAWKWKLHALKNSKKAIKQVIPMPPSTLIDLTRKASIFDKWEALYTAMEDYAKLVNHMWLLVQGRIQGHRYLRTALREDFLQHLVSHCTEHAREMAEKDSQINIEALKGEMRDVQIQKQNSAFKEIIDLLKDEFREDQLPEDLLSDCLQRVQEHVRESKLLKENWNKLLADKENQQNELRLQVKNLEEIISEMEQKERAIAKQLYQTQEDHKRDVNKLMSHMETLIDKNERDREVYQKKLDETIEQNQSDRETYQKKLDDTIEKAQSDREAHNKKFDETIKQNKSDNEAQRKKLDETRKYHDNDLSVSRSTATGGQSTGISHNSSVFEAHVREQEHGGRDVVRTPKVKGFDRNLNASKQSSLPTRSVSNLTFPRK